MRILVCGSRWFGHRDSPTRIAEKRLFEYTMCGFEGQDPMKLTIIQGGAPGADRLAKLWAKRVGCGHEEYPADWDRYGKRAGFLRNRQMLRQGKPNLVIAFFVDERSKGTSMMADIAHKGGVPVWEIMFRRPV